MHRRMKAALAGAAVAVLAAGCATAVAGTAERGAGAPATSTSSTPSTTKDVTRTTTTTKSTTTTRTTTSTRSTTSTTSTTESTTSAPPTTSTPEEDPFLTGQALADDLRVNPYVMMWTVPETLPAGWVEDADSTAFRHSYSIADDNCILITQTWKDDAVQVERDALAQMITDSLPELDVPAATDIPWIAVTLSDAARPQVGLSGLMAILPGGQIRAYGITSGQYGATVIYSCLNSHLSLVDTEIYTYITQLELLALPAPTD